MRKASNWERSEREARLVGRWRVGKYWLGGARRLFFLFGAAEPGEGGQLSVGAFFGSRKDGRTDALEVREVLRRQIDGVGKRHCVH